jgi:hypothetical protein
VVGGVGGGGGKGWCQVVRVTVCTRTILLTATVSFNLLDQYGTKPGGESPPSCSLQTKGNNEVFSRQ